MKENNKTYNEMNADLIAFTNAALEDTMTHGRILKNDVLNTLHHIQAELLKLKTKHEEEVLNEGADMLASAVNVQDYFNSKQ